MGNTTSVSTMMAGVSSPSGSGGKSGSGGGGGSGKKKKRDKDKHGDRHHQESHSSSAAESATERARKVFGDVQETLKISVKKLEEQDHPAAHLIDSVCGPYLDPGRDGHHGHHGSSRDRDRSKRGDGKMRENRSSSFYSEDNYSDDDRTLSEDEQTLDTDYNASTVNGGSTVASATTNDNGKKSSKSRERDHPSSMDSSYLSQSDYESEVGRGKDRHRSSKKSSRDKRDRRDRDRDDPSVNSEDDEGEDSSKNTMDNQGGPTTTTTTTSSTLISKPLASSFAKRCYFTKAGIGKTTQHYEGLTLTGNVVLMLAAAMKLKGCPTICDEDLRRVEQTYPNQFSRLPDELLLSSGWRRISKYCHFSNKPIPDGIPFFHSKQRMHPQGGYYFLLAAAVGMVRPIDVEPLTRDTLVLLETDYPTQCDAAPEVLIQDPEEWTLVDKFCFFSGGPINTEEDVYYQADFDGNPIYMLAFLSPSLTPEELYKLEDPTDGTGEVDDQGNPIPGLTSVAAVQDVESVYDLTERDFHDLKLYHLGPCRALPQYILQPQAWSKVLPPHFLEARHRAILRAQEYEMANGGPVTPVPQAQPGPNVPVVPSQQLTVGATPIDAARFGNGGMPPGGEYPPPPGANGQQQMMQQPLPPHPHQYQQHPQQQQHMMMNQQQQPPFDEPPPGHPHHHQQMQQPLPHQQQQHYHPHHHPSSGSVAAASQGPGNSSMMGGGGSVHPDESSGYFMQQPSPPPPPQQQGGYGGQPYPPVQGGGLVVPSFGGDPQQQQYHHPHDPQQQQMQQQPPPPSQYNIPPASPHSHPLTPRNIPSPHPHHPSPRSNLPPSSPHAAAAAASQMGGSQLSQQQQQQQQQQQAQHEYNQEEERSRREIEEEGAFPSAPLDEAIAARSKETKSQGMDPPEHLPPDPEAEDSVAPSEPPLSPSTNPNNVSNASGGSYYSPHNRHQHHNRHHPNPQDVSKDESQYTRDSNMDYSNSEMVSPGHCSDAPSYDGGVDDDIPQYSYSASPDKHHGGGGGGGGNVEDSYDDYPEEHSRDDQYYDSPEQLRNQPGSQDHEFFNAPSAGGEDEEDYEPSNASSFDPHGNNVGRHPDDNDPHHHHHHHRHLGVSIGSGSGRHHQHPDDQQYANSPGYYDDDTEADSRLEVQESSSAEYFHGNDGSPSPIKADHLRQLGRSKKAQQQSSPHRGGATAMASPMSQASSQNSVSEYSHSTAMRGAQELLKRNRQRRHEQARRRQNANSDVRGNESVDTDGSPLKSSTHYAFAPDQNYRGNQQQRSVDEESASEWGSNNSEALTSVISGSSVWTDTSSNPADRSSRRALILQMAKARMKSNKERENPADKAIKEEKSGGSSTASRDDDYGDENSDMRQGLSETTPTDLDFAADLD